MLNFKIAFSTFQKSMKEKNIDVDEVMKRVLETDEEKKPPE